jgi:hypothetical protein
MPILTQLSLYLQVGQIGTEIQSVFDHLGHRRLCVATLRLFKWLRSSYDEKEGHPLPLPGGPQWSDDLRYIIGNCNELSRIFTVTTNAADFSCDVPEVDRSKIREFVRQQPSGPVLGGSRRPNA